MSDNKNLAAAKNRKNNEFYTRLEDIEKELVYYKSYFKDKIVYCNCDSATSNFYNFFKQNFNELGLKKLYTTFYHKPNGVKFELNKDGYATGINLAGDGDFCSDECLKILKECDIVVTNPPFSLFRQFISLLINFDKKFLVIGNMNAGGYKEIFQHFKNNKIWFGMTSPKIFIKPDGTEQKFGNILWFTNLEHNKRHTPIELKKTYCGNEEDYPKYDNYNAIEVSKVVNIPKDYEGLMGVPITFLNKYCPEQFELIGTDHDLHGDGGPGISEGQFSCCGKNLYRRILIKNKIMDKKS